MGSSLVTRARLVARRLLGAGSQRFAHSAGVAATVREVAGMLRLGDAEELEAAAWVHDVGYAVPLARSGLHALDGARHLQLLGMSPLIVSLVAHHSCALLEARRKGLHEELGRFAPPPRPLMDVIDHADATASKDGRHVPALQRLSEAAHRHQDDSARYGALLMAMPAREAAVKRVRMRLSEAVDGAWAFETAALSDDGSPRSGDPLHDAC